MKNKILRMPQVIEICGHSKSSIYALMAKNLFPKSIKISERAIGWLESDIQEWIDSKVRDGGRHA